MTAPFQILNLDVTQLLAFFTPLPPNQRDPLRFHYSQTQNVPAGVFKPLRTDEPTVVVAFIEESGLKQWLQAVDSGLYRAIQYGFLPVQLLPATANA